MNLTQDCVAVIPCLNEGPTIGPLVRSVRAHVATVLVIDDGSEDDTFDRARSAGATVLRHPVRRGKGAALRTGWQHASRSDYRWVLTLDGDGQHDPSDIPLFGDCAGRTFAKLIVGNRMQHAREMPLVRKWVNQWMSRRISIAAGRAFPDSQCGFRLIDLHALSRLAIAENHFEIESAVLLAFARGGFRVEFVPVRVIYKTGHSKIHPVKDTLRWFRWWWRNRSAHPQRAVPLLSPPSHEPGSS